MCEVKFIVGAYAVTYACIPLFFIMTMKYGADMRICL